MIIISPSTVVVNTVEPDTERVFQKDRRARYLNIIRKIHQGIITVRIIAEGTVIVIRITRNNTVKDIKGRRRKIARRRGLILNKTFKPFRNLCNGGRISRKKNGMVKRQGRDRRQGRIRRQNIPSRNSPRRIRGRNTVREPASRERRISDDIAVRIKRKTRKTVNHLSTPRTYLIMTMKTMTARMIYPSWIPPIWYEKRKPETKISQTLRTSFTKSMRTELPDKSPSFIENVYYDRVRDDSHKDYLKDIRNKGSRNAHHNSTLGHETENVYDILYGSGNEINNSTEKTDKCIKEIEQKLPPETPYAHDESDKDKDIKERENESKITRSKYEPVSKDRHKAKARKQAGDKVEKTVDIQSIDTRFSTADNSIFTGSKAVKGT